VQDHILETAPQSNLKVYAIWTEKLFADSRSRWDAAGLTDRRVVHLWDGRDVSGAWFARQLDGYGGPDWDFYLLFGPDAEWREQPAPLIGSGATVIGKREQLAAQLRSLAAQQPS
jgi:hypothetical protein